MRFCVGTRLGSTPSIARREAMSARRWVKRKNFEKNKDIPVQLLDFVCGIESDQKPLVMGYFSWLNEIFDEKYRASYSRCPVPEESKKLVRDFKEED